MNSRERLARVRAWLGQRWALVALSVLVAGCAIGMHRNGHGWGDDFTLYLRQSRSLLDGNVGQVLADNHFNVDNAEDPGYSPFAYPWGFPLLLAPFYRLFGLDYAIFKLVEVACLIGFLWGFHAVIRHRMSKWLAFATVASVGTTVAYLLHTDKVVSEFPYMAALAFTLWFLDRLRRDQPLDLATRGQLIALGLSAMFVFNVRREGLAIVAAIAVAQLFDLRGRWRSADRRQVATPYVTFLGSAALLHLILPTALAPELVDTGLHQTWRKLQGSFPTSFADQVGSADLRGAGLLLVFLLVEAGLVIRLWRAPSTDAPLAVFAIGSMAIVGMIPAETDRYVLAITPFAVYFAAQAVAAIPLHRDSSTKDSATRRSGHWLATGILAVLCVAHLTDLPSAVREAQEFNDSGEVVDGPEAPYAQAAFTAIRTYTHQDDVVAFFKVRALTFYTDRRGVQSSVLEVVRQRADYFMMRRNSDDSQLDDGQPKVTDIRASAMGWTAVWQDDNWVLWRLPLYESG